MWLLVFEHVSLHGHKGFLEICIVTLIDKSNGADPTRKAKYWTGVLETAATYELNMVD